MTKLIAVSLDIPDLNFKSFLMAFMIFFNFSIPSEKFHPKGYFKCRFQNIYLNINDVCDGKIDCLYSNDELLCYNYSINNCPFNCECPLLYKMNCNYKNQRNFNDTIFFNTFIKSLILTGVKEEYNLIINNNYSLIIFKLSNSLIKELKFAYLKNIISLDISSNKIENLT